MPPSPFLGVLETFPEDILLRPFFILVWFGDSWGFIDRKYKKSNGLWEIVATTKDKKGVSGNRNGVKLATINPGLTSC